MNSSVNPPDTGSDGSAWRRVIVKLNNNINVPYEDGVERYLGRAELGDDLQITFQRLFRTPIRIPRADALEVPVPPPLNTYYVVRVPPGVDPYVLAARLARRDDVETAYVDPPSEEPAIQPEDDTLVVQQGYLVPAPVGVDAYYAWAITPGGDGAGIQLADLERSWLLTHEDLALDVAAILYPPNQVICTDINTISHGTAVLGIVGGRDNVLGIIGLAPKLARIYVMSYCDPSSSRAEAIWAAAAVLNPGDVILLEAQTAFSEQFGLGIPIEVVPAEFDAIHWATYERGVVIVAAAGNGHQNLDDYRLEGRAILQPASPDFRDSGAILVGAGTPSTPHQRCRFSNHGWRVDCYAWGDQITTCWYDPSRSGLSSRYIDVFNGTSGAAAIIAGVAVLVQSLARQHRCAPFTPAELRAILRNPINGTQSANPPSDQIGPMPSLRKIVENMLPALAHPI